MQEASEGKGERKEIQRCLYVIFFFSLVGQKRENGITVLRYLKKGRKKKR